MHRKNWQIINKNGKYRIIVTKELHGKKWIELMTKEDCRVEICTSTDILSKEEIIAAINKKCDGALGQLTENWDEDIFKRLHKANCKVYSNYAVGYDNVDVCAATKQGILVGNTPGVLTEATAEMAVALTFSVARRVVEADFFMRRMNFKGWLPSLFLGELISRKTLGIIGAGRIGSKYAIMMIKGFNMNLLYFDIKRNRELEKEIDNYNKYRKLYEEGQITYKYINSIEEILAKADIVSLHPILNKETHHIINSARLKLMKKNAILINVSRGPVIDELALIDHCKKNGTFKAGLDVYEEEPKMKPDLEKLKNIVIVPHIASATRYTRESMAILAALNIVGILKNLPANNNLNNITSFLKDKPPAAVPSIINALELNYPIM